MVERLKQCSSGNETGIVLLPDEIENRSWIEKKNRNNHIRLTIINCNHELYNYLQTPPQIGPS